MLWSEQISRLLPQRDDLQKELESLDQAQRRRQAATAYLQSIEHWCAALGSEIAQASYDEKHHLLRGLKTKVTCYALNHDPRYVVEWDLAGLREPLHSLLPSLTDNDIADICELNNTYFRHQSADYQPGEGFVFAATPETETAEVGG